MFCSIKKKRGSVKYYLNQLPTDIIYIINSNSKYKYHMKKNEKLLKQIKREIKYQPPIAFENYIWYIRPDKPLDFWYHLT